VGMGGGRWCNPLNCVIRTNCALATENENLFSRARCDRRRAGTCRQLSTLSELPEPKGWLRLHNIMMSEGYNGLERVLYTLTQGSTTQPLV